MLGTMTLALALSSVGAPQQAPHSKVRVVSQPTPPVATAPATIHDDASTSQYAGQYEGESGGCDSCGCGRCGGCRGCSLHGSLHNLFWRSHSTCDMAPPEWSCAETHGYYYFRPYNYGHVAAHQEFAAAWGIDTRNPYSNEFLKSVYEQVEEKWRLEAGQPAVIDVEEITPPTTKGKTSQQPGTVRGINGAKPLPSTAAKKQSSAKPSARSAGKISEPATVAKNARPAPRGPAPAAAQVRAAKPSKVARASAQAEAGAAKKSAVTKTSIVVRGADDDAQSSGAQSPAAGGWQPKKSSR